ncbi:MAG: sugar phosphate isomerase/epimerase [Lachnospiraceae bacterium]|jgi:sugar phosphate isomerase/epimerase|nr:sugar phosphate isomerase/epimerase [Lachnospiraceae bacterium]
MSCKETNLKERFSFSTAALFPRESEASLRLIKAAGFANAELMPQCLSDVKPESVRQFSKIGIRVASIHFPLAFFPMLYTAHHSMREDGREFSRALLSLGVDLGTKVLVIHPHEPSNKDFDKLLDEPVIENILWLADECEKKGILMAMENSPKTCATPYQLTKYVEGLAHNNIKPMIDTTESREAGISPTDFAKEFMPCHLHLSDYKDDVKHLPAGEGDTDFSTFREAIKGYEGFYTLEPAYRYYLDDAPNKLSAGYEFLERNFTD